MIAFYCMSLLFIICNEAHYASKSVGADFQDRLFNVNLTAVDNLTAKEVEMFLVAIEKNPPVMHLNGFANINRELLTSVWQIRFFNNIITESSLQCKLILILFQNISFMATYLVVLLQFKLSLLRQTILDAMRVNATMAKLQMNEN